MMTLSGDLNVFFSFDREDSVVPLHAGSILVAGLWLGWAAGARAVDRVASQAFLYALQPSGNGYQNTFHFKVDVDAILQRPLYCGNFSLSSLTEFALTTCESMFLPCCNAVTEHLLYCKNMYLLFINSPYEVSLVNIISSGYNASVSI